VRFGSFSTEAAGSAARSTSAWPQKLTSGPYKKLVAMGHLRNWLGSCSIGLLTRDMGIAYPGFGALVVVI
jgi:hypothetical protein